MWNDRALWLFLPHGPWCTVVKWSCQANVTTTGTAGQYHLLWMIMVVFFDCSRPNEQILGRNERCCLQMIVSLAFTENLRAAPPARGGNACGGGRIANQYLVHWFAIATLGSIIWGERSGATFHLPYDSCLNCTRPNWVTTHGKRRRHPRRRVLWCLKLIENK